jgi:N-acetylneuraminate lyase
MVGPMSCHIFVLLVVGCFVRFVDSTADFIKANKITDIVAAVYSPMKDGGLELDLAVLKPYAQHLARVNVSSILVAGTTGDSLSLTMKERKQLAEAWAQEASGRNLKVYVHVGCESLLDTVELARHAAALPGVAGIVAMPTVFFKPSLQTLVQYLRAVAQAAPKMPLWYYHIPSMTGVFEHRANEVLSLIHESGDMPNFVGVKFTDPDLDDFKACREVGSGKYNMLFGQDALGLSGLSLGADGVVSSTVNYSPWLRTVFRSYRSHDETAAKAAQKEVKALCSIFPAYGAAAKNVQRAAMILAGVKVGPSRLPMTDLSASEYSDLRQQLVSGGLIDRDPSEGIAASYEAVV